MLAVFLIGIGVLIGVLVSGSRDDSHEDAASSQQESETKPDPSTATQPELATPPEPDAFKVGDTFTVGAVTLTIKSMEIVDSIATSQGEPITADAGGQLLRFQTTYSNSKNQADLSCGSSDLYTQVFDTQEREMAQVFETRRIPGNPGCNDQLLQDVPAEWTLVFQSVSGAKPLAMSVTETVNWLDPIWIDLQ